jgi:coenzyme F420-reducing hydrogenase alpha subunit
MARVEGEGALHLKIRGGRVADVKLKIFEPPRFFEAFLRGRKWTEAPDITARICGICPIAYQSSSISAMDSIVGAKIDGPVRELRRLVYCGEWIESHVLHIAMLHAPDFLGYEDAIQMAKDHPEIVKKALRLKKTGNDLMTLLGGREIHPINLRVGGFYKTPRKDQLLALREDLLWACDAAAELAKLTAAFDFPDFERDYEFVAMRHPNEYPLWEGRLVSNKGLDIPIEEFFAHFEEEHVAHSTALQSFVKLRGAYFVGPLARFNLNFDQLTPRCQELARACGVAPPCTNPFKSIVARAVETLYACEEALRIVEHYEEPDRPYVELAPRAGRGHGCSEAPRGICYHTYAINSDGVILDARIAPPTAQNQRTMEEDLAEFVPRHLDLPDDKLTWRCEQAVRNYDPCISCSCHFLKLHIDRD